VVDLLTQLRSIAARLSTLDADRSSLISERDRQIINARAAGFTWGELQQATGLSSRGLKLAIDRHSRIEPE
jgi:hypothetical protein